jgi:hypothetical protein
LCLWRKRISADFLPIVCKYIAVEFPMIKRKGLGFHLPVYLATCVCLFLARTRNPNAIHIRRGQWWGVIVRFAYIIDKHYHITNNPSEDRLYLWLFTTIDTKYPDFHITSHTKNIIQHQNYCYHKSHVQFPVCTGFIFIWLFVCLMVF